MKSLLAFLALLLPELALAATGFSREFPAGLPRYAPAPGLNNGSISVASDGNGFYAVWLDSRDSVPAIVGTRVSSSGEALDPMGIRLVEPRAPAQIEEFRIVRSESSYVLVWTLRGSRTMAAHLDAEGRFSDGPRVIAEGSLSSVAVNGAHILIAYSGEPDGWWGQRLLLLDDSLNVLSDVPLGLFVHFDRRPSLIAYGEGFFAVWMSGYYVPDKVLHGTRVSASGVIVESKAMPASATVESVGLVSSDGNDLLIVGSARIQDSYHTRTMLIANDFSQIRMVTDVPSEPNRHGYVAAFWAGDDYVAVGFKQVAPSGRNMRVIFSRFARDGRQTQERAGNLIGNRQWGIGLTAQSNGTKILLAWNDYAPPESDRPVMSQLAAIDAPEEESAVRPLTISAVQQYEPAVSTGPEGMFLVAWREKHARIYATRMTEDGRSLDGEGVWISPPDVSDVKEPRACIAFDGRQFVLPFVTGKGRVIARFISPVDGVWNGELALAPDGAPGSDIAAAAGGGGTLIAWIDTDDRVAVARVGAATRTLLTPPVPLTRLPADPRYPKGRVAHPAAAWNGSEYLVAWIELELMWSYGYYYEPRAIRAIRLSADLLPRDTEPFTIGEATGRIGNKPSIASNGKDWLVVWDDQARRVFADGALSPPARILLNPGFGTALAWDGVRYAVAWAEDSLKLAYLSADGPLFLSAPNVVRDQVRTIYPSIAAGSANRVAIAYVRIAREELYGGVERAFIRIGAPSISKRRAAR